MADLSTVIQLIFSADSAEAERALQSINKDLSAMKSGIDGIAQPIGNFADGLLKMEAAALALASAIGVMAVKETVKFQDSLYSVQKQLGDSGVSIEEARKSIEGLALQYGINANDIAGSMANFLAAGNDYANSAKLVEASTQLMIAGQLEAQFATDAINKSLSGFRIPAEDAAAGATKVGDILNKIGDISSGKFEEIVEGFSRISPTAKDAGLSMEETAAIIARLVDVFGSGEIAATALKSGLLSLLNPSDEAAETLAKLGVSTTDANGELRSSKDLLADLAGKWNTLTDAQKQQTAAILFGKEQAGAMSVVLGDWSKSQDYLNQLLDKTTGAVGSMAREVEGKLNLISTSVERSTEAWRQFLENLGARLTSDPEKNLQGLIDSLGLVGTAFKDVVNQGGFDPILNLVQSQAGELSALFKSVAQNLPAAFENLDFSGVVSALELLGDTIGELFKAFFGDIDITTVDGLTQALQFLVDGFEALTVTVSGILLEFRPMLDAIGRAIESFTALDRASQLEFGSTLGAFKLIADAGIAVGLVLVGIGEAGLKMGGILDVVVGGVRVGVNILQVAFDTFALALSGVVGLIASVAAEALAALGFDEQAASLQRGVQAIQDVMRGIEENAARNAQEAAEGAQQVARGWETLTTEGGKAGESLREVRERLLATKDATKPAAEGIDQTTESLAELGKIEIKPLEVFEALPEEADKAGKAMVKAGDAAGELVPKLVEVRDANGNLVKTYTDLVPAMEKTGGTFSVIGKGVDDLATSGDKAEKALKDLTNGGKLTYEQLMEVTKAANDFKVKMEEIASNERIKNIEAKVSLDIARLEADTKQVEAAFESINNTISSTGEVLGGLYENFAGAGSNWDKAKFESWIDEENARRDKALEMQNGLIEAQIDAVKARTDALTRGDSMITVNGDGLAPHLEAFMWEILKAIQVRASADMQEFLLGV